MRITRGGLQRFDFLKAAGATVVGLPASTFVGS
jgi:hypothetical protein